MSWRALHIALDEIAISPAGAIAEGSGLIGPQAIQLKQASMLQMRFQEDLHGGRGEVYRELCQCRISCQFRIKPGTWVCGSRVSQNDMRCQFSQSSHKVL